MQKTAIVILNYKTWQDTLAEAQLVHDLFEIDWSQIIIVDNASPNESVVELAKQTIGNYVFIKSHTNNGYASGNNIGLRYAYENGFDYAWILNNDILIDNKNVLSEMLRIFTEDSMVAAVSPDIFSPEGYLFNRNAKKRSVWDYTLGAYAYKKKGRTLQYKSGYGYIYRPQGCCMLLDLQKMNEIHYLDEKTFLYFEEPILAERLCRKQYTCACATNVSVIHNHSKTVKNNIQKWKIIQIQSESFDYYLREYRNFNILKRVICLLFNAIEYVLLG